MPLWLIIVLAAFVVSAQDGRALTSGTPVSGQLDSANFVQVYTIAAAAGDSLTVTASNTLGIPLALVVTDATGNLVAQVSDEAVSGEVTLTSAGLSAGTYFVTVFKAAGIASSAAVPFTLTATIAGTQAATEVVATPEVPVVATEEPTVIVSEAGGQLLTTTGMVVNLSWGTISDLDLEVRDPIGGSLYFQTPTTASGGTLGPNVNQGCVNTTPNAVETGTWSPGGIPTGSYEVLVYYQQGCEGETPVTFSVAATVDGLSIGEASGTLLPGQVFVTSFVVRADGASGFSGLSGVVADQILPDTAASIVASATPLNIGSAINGALSTQNPYDSYSFTVQANEFITISMNATTGSLDTFLLLLDPQGSIVRSNDDAVDGNTDSAISNALLTVPGTYTIVATRYGKRVGGTEGNYTLSLSTQTSSLPEEFLNLPRGILEFTLLWDTDDDLQLLVRDPAGDAVFDDSPTARSGGTLAADGNVNCVAAETSTPFSYIYWPTAPRPGIYEIEVWFQSECTTANAANFNLIATYNGQEVFNVSAEPILGERYLISFTLNPDGTIVLSDGGIISGLTSLPYQAEIENAVPVTAGIPVNGSITQDNKFDLYIFNAAAGDLISIAMNGTSGTLDPALYLVGPFGNLIAENDDTVPGENRNSFIANLTLPETGQYIIIATHFGALYGGTTGTYSVTLTQLN